MMRRLLLPAAAAVALLAPAAATAQACGIVPGLAAAGGYVAYDVGSTSGIAVGADVGVAADPVLFQVGYRRAVLEGDAAQPDIVRGVVAVPVADAGGMTTCVTAHAGGTRFSFEDDTGGVLAGGVGLTLTTTESEPVQPFLTVRGLGASATGTVLGLDVDASGFSLGVEAGLVAALGPVALRVAGSLDGFDDGLGVTPYANQAVEVGLGIRF